MKEERLNAKENRTTYWWNRLEQDSLKLTDEQRLSLVKAILINHCSLTQEELSVFLDPTFSPSPENIDNALIYANAEGKIGDFYSTSFPEKGIPEYKNLEEHHKTFMADFRKTLERIAQAVEESPKP